MHAADHLSKHCALNERVLGLDRPDYTAGLRPRIYELMCATLHTTYYYNVYAHLAAFVDLHLVVREVQHHLHHIRLQLFYD